MARVQAQYAPRATGLQQLAAPTIHTVQARLDTVEDDPASRLARALGVVDTGRLQQSMKLVEDDQKRQATAFANSMTVDELGKKVRSGEVLPSQSPAFGATVQHIYGENSQKTFERDFLQKLSSGELKFSTPQEMDEYLTKARNEHLDGQSQYTIAGFDKGWNSFRDQANGFNTKINDKAAVDRGVAEASDVMSNDLLDVTSDKFKGTPDEAAAKLMSRYGLLTNTQVLRDDARKEVLTNVLTRIAGSGNKPLLEAMLRQKLPNGGPTIEGLMGGRSALTLGHAADAQYDRDQRQRVDVEAAPFMRSAANGELDPDKFEKWRSANEKYVSSSFFESILRANESAQARIDKANERHGNLMEQQKRLGEASQVAGALVAGRRGHEMPDVAVPTAEGGSKTIKGEDIVAAEVDRRVAADPKMPFDEQVRLYANNSVENKKWKADFNSAYVNIGEVGVDAKGKPVGELLPATVEALDKFAVINQHSTGYARQLAGSDSKYQLLVNLQALRESGVPDVNLAASLVNQAERNTAKNSESINAQVHSAVNDITNPGVLTGRFWAEVFSGEWGEGEKNVRQIEGSVRSLAKAYMAANMAPSGKEAVKKAVEYYANPAVTTQINNTVYFNKDLPRVPDKQDQRFWFQRYMDEEVAKWLKGQGITYDKEDIVMHSMAGGEGRYMLHLRGTPLGKEFLRRDVEKWIVDTDKKDITERIHKRQEQEELRKKSSRQGKPPAIIEFDTPGGAALRFQKP